MFLKRLRRCIVVCSFFLLALLALIYCALYQQINEALQTYYQNRGKTEYDDISKEVETELDNLPWDFVKMRKINFLRMNASCANYPKLLELEFHNKYWQKYKNGEIQMRIYGAYYDKRPTLPHRAAIRLLALINQSHKVRLANFCQVWFLEHMQPTIVKVARYEMLWHRDWLIPRLHFPPYLMSCILPESVEHLIPQAVSLVSAPCHNASNNFRVIYEPPSPNKSPSKFGICVKGLSFPYSDLSTVLIEWLELMRLFGVDKVYINTVQIHSNISKVIRYYEEQNFVQARTTTVGHFANELPHSQQFAMRNYKMNRRYHEMLQYNDCFYRNIYKYEFLAIVDIDEIIMPLEPYMSWLELLKTAKHHQLEPYKCKNAIDAFCFRHTHFPLNVPIGVGSPPLQFLQHLQRNEKFSNVSDYVKCWHNTSTVLAVHNHFPFYHISDDNCDTIVDQNVAKLQHYRHTIKDNQDLGELIADDNILRFSQSLTNRSFKVFYELGFLTGN